MDNYSDSILKKAKNIILSSNVNWVVRNEDSDIVNLIYSEEGEKASCCTSCCLGIFFMPIGIIYAILGGKKAIKKQINVHYANGEITLSGDPQFIINIYDKLINSEIGMKVKENENLINAKKSKNIKNVAIIIGVIILLFIIVNSGKNV